MSYQIVIHPKALKEIKKLPLKEIRKIEAKIDGLATLPRPWNCNLLLEEFTRQNVFH